VYVPLAEDISCVPGSEYVEFCPKLNAFNYQFYSWVELFNRTLDLIQGSEVIKVRQSDMS